MGLALAAFSVAGAWIFRFKYSHVPSIFQIGAFFAIVITSLSIYFCYPADSKAEAQLRNVEWKNAGYSTLSIVIFMFGVFLSINGVILGLLGLVNDLKLSFFGLLILSVGLLAFKSAKNSFRNMEDTSDV